MADNPLGIYQICKPEMHMLGNSRWIKDQINTNITDAFTGTGTIMGNNIIDRIDGILNNVSKSEKKNNQRNHW